ncbi:MAG TPA: sn-glycerol-3-phosphate ABC transporter ATP-binding protein UgpC [Candidatus Limnocylindrales bacterium]|nr:sn-glycerol-3-phosphate ABC transporter ATP-binding protein UgpC [Candidatus Limnocylindrales bacterium]
MASLKLININKRFPNGFHAVKDVNLDIVDKEFVVLVGPSGCGKTTILRMIAGLEEISSGEVYIDDRLINNVPPKDRDIAMAFQNYALYPHMTVFENMAFGLKMRKVPKEEIKKSVKKTAAILGLDQLLDRKPRQLSGGQRQRVALGRAIVRDPKAFLMDEPLSNLDAKLRVQTRAELSKLHRRLETTFVYVTHDQTEAMTMGTRIVVLKDGIVQQVSDPAVLYNFPINQFVAGFIGSPQMNFLGARIIELNGALSVQYQSGSTTLPVKKAAFLKNLEHPGREVNLGIRPEHILVEKSAAPGENSAVVDVVEPLGSETYLFLNLEGTTVIARVDPSLDMRVNDLVTVKFDPDKIHLFDVNTEKALFAREPA